MKLRYGIRKWIVKRWFDDLVLECYKEIILSIGKIIISIVALLLAIPFLILECSLRLVLIIMKKYEVEE